MVDTTFSQGYGDSSRIASVRAARTTSRHSLPLDLRSDLKQEALLELWRKQAVYDPRRGSWRTFCERVVANRLVSLVRRMRVDPADHFRQTPLDDHMDLNAPLISTDLRSDVARVLARVSEFDRSVALLLVNQSVVETSRTLAVARSTVYVAILRLRTAFANAGLRAGSPRHSECSRAARIAEVKR